MSDTVPSSMVRRRMVLVAIQYRLGALGFLRRPALTAGRAGLGQLRPDGSDRGAEVGEGNIARFGGNPENVTISASGGRARLGLLLAPSTEGGSRARSRRAVRPVGLPPRRVKENEALGERFARRAGAPEGEGGLEALRALPPERILAAEARLRRQKVDFVWLEAVRTSRC